MAAVLTPEGLDSLITTERAATLCCVGVSTIRKWAHEKRIEAVDTDDRGRKLYMLRDIARAELQTRERARRTFN